MIQIKLLELQKQWIWLKKDAKNPFFKSNYITLDNIIETFNPLLTKQKIVCYHYTKENKLNTCLYDTEDNTFIESEFNIYTNDPQKQGSEITYWKRYNLWQLLNIMTDVDDDWNKASSDWNTRKFHKTWWEKHTCKKCGALNENVEIKQWKFWPYFTCEHCWQFTNSNPYYEKWENLAEVPAWDTWEKRNKT